MADRTSVPILVDGDTGYGNFNNARRLIRKLESRGIAGVCIEDKVRFFYFFFGSSDIGKKLFKVSLGIFFDDAG
tara:strand:- start:302 stop:523 length:222 start_codon:yes stop_codon:yes gene_type:complete